MNVDFKDAVFRHYRDAQFLRKPVAMSLVGDSLGDYFGGSWGNADQLYGYAAECGLKAVMIGLNPSIINASTGDLMREYRIHINKLWSEFNIFANKHNGAKYLNILPPDTNPFDNWNISQRYANSGDFTQAIVERHQSAASIVVKEVLQQAILDLGI
ncbi:MAG: hypothetical protein GY862_00625 [Gammaproteobacteria bacterium]|nr:hypothetical protein [Gammaproteobacteria bacterium]